MFYTLLTIIFILPALAGFGKFFLKTSEKREANLSFSLLSGTVFLTVFWTAIAFFCPLNFMVEDIFLVIGFLLFFYLKAYEDFWNFLKKCPPIFFVVLAISLFFSSIPPFNLDHFGYYVPTINWLSNFGFTKGIANLDLLLGQMSLWHIFQAGFSHFSDPFFRINAIAATVYLIYIFERKAWLHLVFSPILFLFLSSPSPDFPAIAFGLIVLNELLAGNKNFGFLFIISAFIFAIKPTMLWAPMAVAILSILNDRKKIFPLIPGILIVLLFIIKNCYCFGFPIFPMQFPNFGFPWQPNGHLTEISSQVAVSKTFDMQYSYAEIMKFTKLQFIKNWLFLKGMKGYINVLFLVTLLILARVIIKKRNLVLSVIFISVLAKSIFVLLFSAQYRFFIDVFFAAFLIIFWEKLNRKIVFPIFLIVSSIFAVGLINPKIITNKIPSFRLGSMMKPWDSSLIYKPGNYNLNSFKTYKIGNLKFNVVKNYPFTFDTPQPAISPSFLKQDYDAGIFPQQIGESPKDGFYWKNLSPKEKSQLKSILSEIYK